MSVQPYQWADYFINPIKAIFAFLLYGNDEANTVKYQGQHKQLYTNNYTSHPRQKDRTKQNKLFCVKKQRIINVLKLNKLTIDRLPQNFWPSAKVRNDYYYD